MIKTAVFNCKRTRVYTVGIISLLITLTACHSGHHKEKGPTFQVTSPWRADQDFAREYVAQIHAIQHIEIRAFERGYLQNTFVDEGQLVKKDEKLFEIMPAIKNAEYNKAKAELDLAQLEYKNTQSLAQKMWCLPMS